MKDLAKLNQGEKGMELIPIASSVKQDECKGFSTLNVAELWRMVGEYITDFSFLVAYLNNEVLIGHYQEGQPQFYNNSLFDPKYLLSMRIFNQQEELFIWKSDSGLRLRHRSDVQGKSGYAVKMCQLLWGTVVKVEKGWIQLLDEGRGVKLLLPWNKPIYEGDRIQLKTHNYIEYSDQGQAGYIDCRMVDFLVSKEGGRQ